MSPKPLPLMLLSLTASVGCELLPAGRGSARGDQSTNTGGSVTTILTRPQHDTFFPISAGVHSAADCNSCHGGFPSFKEFTCLSCHEHAKQPTDSAHQGINGYQYESKACLSCHQTGTAGNISRTDHSARFFPIDTGSSHGSTQCSDCHSNPKDPRQFTCISCHDHAQDVLAPKHVGVTGYQYDSNACLTCHAKSAVPERSRADHTFFPIDVGTKHASTQCLDCHTNPNDKSQFTCTSCHDHAMAVTTPKHANVADYTYDSAACFKCHSNGLAQFDHSKLGSPPNCLKCHQNALDKATTSPASMHVANKFPTNCESCHQSFTSWGPGTAMQHQVVGGATSKCETCHMGNFAKANTTPASLHVDNKFPTACATCHTSFTSWGPGTKMQHDASGGVTSKCESCHMGNLAKANTTPASLHVDNKFPTACATCHTSFTSWGPGTKMPHDAIGGMNSKCESCHLTDFNKGTTPFNHLAEKAVASACKVCHTNTTTWKSFQHNNNCFNAATLRGHEGAKCAQCHTVPTDYTKSSCTACHSNRGTNCND